REKHENQGYITQQNASLTKAIVAAMRERRAGTFMRWVKGHNSHPGNEKADELSGLGALKQVHGMIDLSVSTKLKLTGCKLTWLTQKLAYSAIRQRKQLTLTPRRRTAANLSRSHLSPTMYPS
ncbi:hypothetical protein L227DRAFT_514999, partial [Lentinus tigrinus ALCF2SS1-6]